MFRLSDRGAYDVTLGPGCLDRGACIGALEEGVLSEGGSKTFAICLPCDERGGRSLSSGWITVVMWIAAPIVVLALAVLLLEMLVR